MTAAFSVVLAFWPVWLTIVAALIAGDRMTSHPIRIKGGDES